MSDRSIPRIVLTSLLTVISGALAVSTASAGGSPLARGVLRANEIAGYAPTAPRIDVLSLDAYGKSVGLEKAAKAQLVKAGFVAAVNETLIGPTSPPPGSRSSSSVLQFGSAGQAKAFLTLITREYFGSSPGHGISLARIGSAGIPGATAARFSSAGPH